MRNYSNNGDAVPWISPIRNVWNLKHRIAIRQNIPLLKTMEGNAYFSISVNIWMCKNVRIYWSQNEPFVNLSSRFLGFEEVKHVLRWEWKPKRSSSTNNCANRLALFCILTNSHPNSTIVPFRQLTEIQFSWHTQTWTENLHHPVG